MPSSEKKEYDDQIVIVDGLGITHFIPRRKDQNPSSSRKSPQKRKK